MAASALAELPAAVPRRYRGKCLPGPAKGEVGRGLGSALTNVLGGGLTSRFRMSTTSSLTVAQEVAW